MRAATFNIRTATGWDGLDSWPFRRRRTAEAIRRLGADVVGLQEAHACQLRWLLRRLPEFASAGVGRDDGRARGEHCAILYRRERLTLLEQSTRWLSETPDVPGSRGWGAGQPRIVTMARFVCAGDAGEAFRFGVANTHWDGGSAAVRERSAALLLSWLNPQLPWIVLGDCNATPADRSVRLLLESGLRDTLARLPASGTGAGTHHRFDGATDGTRIDLILAGPGWEIGPATVVQERIHGRLPSDHWPVLATVSPASEDSDA